MTEIIAVRFKSGGKHYYFDPQGLTIGVGNGVILETSRGVEYGECVEGNTMVEDNTVVQPLRPVIRIATQRDMETVEYNRKREGQAFTICQEKIIEHKLDMKLVEVEFSFEGNKILFFFTSDGRVDFRGLVKDLASIFHARIELRQIGVRDEAKMLGGLGICGRPFCCSSFLDDFQPVSIKMAKTQSLSLNPTKISGTCGRLMCCLKYEQDAYEDSIKRCPKNDSFVETPDGIGNISSVNLLRETVKVRLDKQPETPQVYHHTEVRVVRNGKGKRPEDYVAPPASELAKLRKMTPPPEEAGQALGTTIGQALAGLSMQSTPTAAPAPASQRENANPATRRNNNNRNRNRNKPAGEAPKVEQPKQANPPKAKEGAKPNNQRPKQPQNPKQPNQAKGQNAPKPQNQPKPQNTPKPQNQPKPQTQPKPQAQGQTAPNTTTEDGEKKAPRRHRRYRGNKPKTGGTGAPPKAE